SSPTTRSVSSARRKFSTIAATRQRGVATGTTELATEPPDGPPPADQEAVERAAERCAPAAVGDAGVRRQRQCDEDLAVGDRPAALHAAIAQRARHGRECCAVAAYGTPQPAPRRGEDEVDGRVDELRRRGAEQRAPAGTLQQHEPAVARVQEDPSARVARARRAERQTGR